MPELFSQEWFNLMAGVSYDPQPVPSNETFPVLDEDFDQ